MKNHFNNSGFKSLAILFLFTASLKAQLINPMGKGLKYPPQVVYVDSSQSIKLAVQLHSTQKDSLLSRYLISGWSGSEWMVLTSVVTRVADTTRDFNNLHSVAFFKGQIYVGGTFDSVGYPAIPNTARIARWNTSAWSSLSTGIGTHKESIVRKLEVFSGKIYVAGKAFRMGSDSMLNLLGWSGSQWSKLGSFGPDSVVYDLKRHNGKLLVVGNFLQADIGVLTNAIAAWDGAAWSTLSGYPISRAIDVEAVNDTIYALAPAANGLYYVYRYAGSVWKNISHNLWQYPRSANGQASLANVMNRLWISSETTDPEKSLFYLRDTTWLHMPTDVLGKVMIISSRDSLIVSGKFTRNQENFLDYIGVVKHDIPDLIKVRGIVFTDFNHNCILDSGDKVASNVKVRIQPGNIPAYTDESGFYERYLPRAPYSIKVVLPQGHNLLCVADSLNTDSSGTFRNFPLAPRSSFKNQSVTLSSTCGYKSPKGQVQYLHIRVKNHSPMKDSVVVNLSYDSSLTWIGSSQAPEIQNNNYVSYIIPDLPAHAEAIISVGLRADSAVPALTPLFHKVYLGRNTNNNDSVAVDDIDTLHQFVSAPLDPNDKQSWPMGEIKPGTKNLNYTIRFQNVGTDKAIRVRVIDTIDIDLPLTEVWIKTASHPYKLYIEENVLIWVFDNINLPDSTSDPKGSQGYLNYTAGLKPGLAIGTEITNTAMIYFDYEAPVRTNTVICEIDDGSISVQEPVQLGKFIKLYPNPASQHLSIENKAALDSELRLYDLMGREVWRGTVQAESTVLLDVSHLKNGIYFMRSGNGPASTLMIQH